MWIAPRRRRLGRHDLVVDANADVPLPGAGLIVPEGVARLVGPEQAHCIGEAEIEEGAVAGAVSGLNSASLTQSSGRLTSNGVG
jgi:hypothetical protein